MIKVNKLLRKLISINVCSEPSKSSYPIQSRALSIMLLQTIISSYFLTPHLTTPSLLLTSQTKASWKTPICCTSNLLSTVKIFPCHWFLLPSPRVLQIHWTVDCKHTGQLLLFLTNSQLSTLCWFGCLLLTDSTSIFQNLSVYVFSSPLSLSHNHQCILWFDLHCNPEGDRFENQNTKIKSSLCS